MTVIIFVVSNPCLEGANNCSHMCLLSSESPLGYTCVCPDGFVPSENGKTCSSKQNLCYSGTSHNGLSEIRTTSLQRTNNVPPIVFAIEIIHLQPPRDVQPPISGQRTENVPPKDK